MVTEDEVDILARQIRVVDTLLASLASQEAQYAPVVLQLLRDDLLTVMKMCGASPDETAPFEREAV